MTPEELMKPRIKIIAHWPNMEDDFDSVVGEVIELPSDKWIYSDNEHCEENYFNDWPHLFQPLPWYAERKPEDMPEYVEYDGQVLKVEKWIVENGTVFISLPMPYPAFTIGNKYYKIPTPATHEQYINSKQPI